MNTRIPQLEESRRVAEQEAQLRQEQEQQLRLTLNVLREQEQDHNKRIEEIQKSLSAQVQACYTLEAEVREQAEKEQEVTARLEEVRHAKHASGQTRRRCRDVAALAGANTSLRRNRIAPAH